MKGKFSIRPDQAEFLKPFMPNLEELLQGDADTFLNELFWVIDGYKPEDGSSGPDTVRRMEAIHDYVKYNKDEFVD